MKKKITVIIKDETYDFFYELFKSPDEGVRNMLEAIVPLYKKSLGEIAGIFTRGELYLIIDVFEGMTLKAGDAGTYLLDECLDALHTQQMALKWNIDSGQFQKKLGVLTSFQSAALEFWANAYWYGAGTTGEKKSDSDLEKHIEALL